MILGDRTMKLNKLGLFLGLCKSIMTKAVKNEGGFAIGGVVSMLFVGFIAIMLILQFVPMFETDIVTTTITNPFVKTLIEIAIWAFPAAAVVAILIKAVKKIKG
jgi:hypothetical protein